ncbi:MAG: hypothetical protein SFZ23_09110 [Planctomycetota bacterium]|nr:hypothetical protein [Planctomycetota bacterium]
MPTSLDALKPGQKITCTVTSLPRSDDHVDTIERLMRRDVGVKRALRKAQRMRAQRITIYNRGNRDWVSREKPARVVYVKPGASWSMAYTPELAPDFRSVEKFLSIA